MRRELGCNADLITGMQAPAEALMTIAVPATAPGTPAFMRPGAEDQGAGPGLYGREALPGRRV
jgi:hypothetical protein